MKIAVLSYSGNVGKSLLSQHLLRPRIENAGMFYIESINSGADESQVSGGEFSSVMREVNVLDNAIVDIGSSNIEKVLLKVATMIGVMDDFDYFVIPVIPKGKQETDTVKLINDLSMLDIPANKIKVICNQIEAGSVEPKLFPILFPAMTEIGIAWATVHESETYAAIGSKTMIEAIAEGIDFKESIRNADTVEKKRDISGRQVISRMARGTKAELDSVFATLFGTI